MDNNYWAQVMKARVNRRRGMALLAGTSAGAALLAACGGDDSGDDAQPEDKSGLLAKPQDTSSKGTTGGTLLLSASSDTAGFDALNAIAITPASHNDYVYSRLVNAHKVYNLAKGEQFDTSVDPYAAESWEVSPDRLQYTFKLQPSGGLDPRPPTNGRILDAEDVVFSWNRYRATGRSRALMAADLGAGGAIQSVAALDSRTVQIKLAYPSVSILPLIGFFFYWQIQPREAESGFDPRTTMRGSGPWMLDEYQPSALFRYKKNPNFYRKDRPFLDGIDLPIISEYAQGLAQLKAGRLHSYTVAAEDVLQTKQDVASLNLYQQANFPNGTNYVFFSFKPGSQWQDERLRRALSMLIDRDLYIDTMFDVKRFEDAGLPVQTRWNTIFPASEEPFWLDPKGNDFGSNAANFKYDPAGAKKLVQAVGKQVVEDDFNIINGTQYGPTYAREAEILKGMFEAGGDFRFNTVLHDYATVFLPRLVQYLPNGRDFNGIGLASSTGFPEMDVYLRDNLASGGALNRFEPGFTDPVWEGMVSAQRTELDSKKRLQSMREIQRYHAGKMFTIPRAGSALGFSLWSSQVNNVGALGARLGIQNPSADYLHYWLNR